MPGEVAHGAFIPSGFDGAPFATAEDFGGVALIERAFGGDLPLMADAAGGVAEFNDDHAGKAWAGIARAQRGGERGFVAALEHIDAAKLRALDDGMTPERKCAGGERGLHGSVGEKDAVQKFVGAVDFRT